MALKKCKECGKEVSTSAKKCPNCGVKDPTSNPAITAIITICMLLFLGYMCSTFGDQDSSPKTTQPSIETANSWKNDVDEVAAYVMIQGFIEDRLKSPSTAEFPYSVNASINYLGSQTYEISSYVDSENSFGAMLRTHYKGKIKQTGSEEWTLIELEFN